MQLFLQQVRYLMHTGLARQYRKDEGNSLALRGSLQLGQNIRHNLTHAERFYVRHTVYDRDHAHNAILRITLALISRIALLPAIRSDAASLLLDFPECSEPRISEAFFDKLAYSRKTEAYRPAHGIARLLLLNYHPDIRSGAADVLALMFDMNLLWEKYVLNLLRRALHREAPGKYRLIGQTRTDFWKPADGLMRVVKPDIVVVNADCPDKVILVLDTKWKLIPDNRPSDEDLKQMLVYNLFHGCASSALIYPGDATKQGIEGDYQSAHGTGCSLHFVQLIKRDGIITASPEGIVALIAGK